MVGQVAWVVGKVAGVVGKVVAGVVGQGLVGKGVVGQVVTGGVGLTGGVETLAVRMVSLNWTDCESMTSCVYYIYTYHIYMLPAFTVPHTENVIANEKHPVKEE